jgi:hypothetical protein
VLRACRIDFLKTANQFFQLQVERPRDAGPSYFLPPCEFSYPVIDYWNQFQPSGSSCVGQELDLTILLLSITVIPKGD